MDSWSWQSEDPVRKPATLVVPEVEEDRNSLVDVIDSVLPATALFAMGARWGALHYVRSQSLPEHVDLELAGLMMEHRVLPTEPGDLRRDYVSLAARIVTSFVTGLRQMTADGHLQVMKLLETDNIARTRLLPSRVRWLGTTKAVPLAKLRESMAKTVSRVLAVLLHLPMSDETLVEKSDPIMLQEGLLRS